jgi:energy-converting hydrogenase B subunit D
MIARTAILALLPIVAVIALTQRRRLTAIVGMGLFSFLLAVAYLLLHAPDVALTEATIGLGLITAIYVLAIRRTGRLAVVADEAPGLFAREGERIVGLEHEILERFARHLGLDLSVQLVPHRDVADLVRSGEADVGAGGWVRGEEAGVLVTRPHLDTALFTVGGGKGKTVEGLPRVRYEGYFADLDPQSLYKAEASVTLDLARFLAARRSDVPDEFVTRHPETRGYAFVVNERRRDLHSALDAYIERLRETGELDRLTRRFLA